MTSPDTRLRIGTDLRITDVHVAVQNDRALLAFVTITLNDVFVVHGLKIIDSAKGRFVAMPSRPRRNGRHQDVAHPINQAWRDYMEDEVFAVYDALVDGQGRDGQHGD